MSTFKTHLMGEAEEYLCLLEGARGAGEAGAGVAGLLRAGRGDAGAELVSRDIPPTPRFPDLDANSRNANCSSEPDAPYNL